MVCMCINLDSLAFVIQMVLNLQNSGVLLSEHLGCPQMCALETCNPGHPLVTKNSCDWETTASEQILPLHNATG